MPKLLSSSEVAQYERDGYLFPLRIMSTEDAARVRAEVEDVEQNRLDDIGGKLRHKPHLFLKSLDAIVRNEKLLDAVEDLIGPNILCWAAAFFTKEANDPAFVSWHQDATYWGLSEPDVLTAWVALSPASIESGAMKVVPASQAAGQLPHVETYQDNNLLTRGQEVQVDVDENTAVNMTLEPGEASFHHVRLVHGSGPNQTDDRRIGYAIRYIPTRVHQLLARDSAMLVRGRDEFGHFELEQSPDADFSPQSIRNYLDANERHNAILYQDAEQNRG